jgi:peptidoglycan-N-acetylglucosamine deacetylase
MKIFIITRNTVLKLALFAGILLALVVFVLNMHDGMAPALAPNDNIPIYSVKTKGNQIALTLDVAWGSNMTDRQLDIFDKYNIKATFYVTGRWAELNSDELQRIASRGHEIGSHGHTHLDFVKLSDADMVKELNQASDANMRSTGKRPATFRAPYGSWNARVVDVVCGQQYEFIQWDVDSLDWKGLTPDAMEARVLPIVKSGSIILLHNNGKYTTDVLPSLIEKLQAKGFKFVTVTELINESLEALQPPS